MTVVYLLGLGPEGRSFSVPVSEPKLAWEEVILGYGVRMESWGGRVDHLYFDLGDIEFDESSVDPFGLICSFLGVKALETPEGIRVPQMIPECPGCGKPFFYYGGRFYCPDCRNRLEFLSSPPRLSRDLIRRMDFSGLPKVDGHYLYTGRDLFWRPLNEGPWIFIKKMREQAFTRERLGI